MNRQGVSWLICGGFITLCGAAYLFAARSIRCDHFADPTASSPGGDWVAASSGDACPIGLLSVTDYSVSVTLMQKTNSSQTSPTVIFNQTDAGSLPTLRWASANELVVMLHDPGEVQTSQHESGGVKISYVVPVWMWRNAQTIEVDRARQENESRELRTLGKISEKDLRGELQNINEVAKGRVAFRQWIADNATVVDSQN